MPTGSTGRRAAHPHLGGIGQADLPAGAPVGDHIGQGAQPDSALVGAAALGQQRADLPDGRAQAIGRRGRVLAQPLGGSVPRRRDLHVAGR
jgi:hypothetical protein